jgi:hypothetical protein
MLSVLRMVCFSCDQVVMVVDARNPLFYRCPDLEVCTHSIALFSHINAQVFEDSDPSRDSFVPINL